MFKKEIEERIAEFTNAWFRIADINKNEPAPLIRASINSTYSLDLINDKRWILYDASGDKKIVTAIVNADIHAFPKLIEKYLEQYFV